MRETIVGVAVAALLVAGCGGTSNPTAPHATQASAPAAVPPTAAAAPAESPKPEKRARKAVKVARKPATAARGAKADASGAGDAPTLTLNQSPPSSY